MTDKTMKPIERENAKLKSKINRLEAENRRLKTQIAAIAQSRKQKLEYEQ